MFLSFHGCSPQILQFVNREHIHSLFLESFQFFQNDVSPRLLTRAPLAVRSMVKNNFIQHLEFHTISFSHALVVEETEIFRFRVGLPGTPVNCNESLDQECFRVIKEQLLRDMHGTDLLHSDWSI